MRKYDDDLEHEIIYIFYFLFLQFCKQYLSYGMLLVSLSVFCNHDTLILKSNLKKIASLMRSGFLQVDWKLEVCQK